MNGIPIFPKVGNSDITRDVIHSQWPVGFRVLTSVCITYNGMMCTLCATPSILIGHFFSLYYGHPRKGCGGISGFLFFPNMQYSCLLNNNGFELCRSTYMWIFSNKYSCPSHLWIQPDVDQKQYFCIRRFPDTDLK